jgi:hypothetical protein
MPPHAERNDLTLATENPDKVWFLATQKVYAPTVKRIVTYTVDPRTDQIRSIAIQALKGGTNDVHARVHPPARGWTATAHVATLKSAPDLPAPKPACD